ncbi:MAG: diaminopimelate epimerase [Pseudomonadota bacterium]
MTMLSQSLKEALHPLDGCPYWLMDGVGNDFVIVDIRGGGKMTGGAARTLGERSGPFGCDQIISLERAGSDTAMGIWNADGSTAGACGNAARCVGWLLMEGQGTNKVRFGAPGGVLEASRTSRKTGDKDITVDMGEPKLHWQQIPLAEQMDDTRFIDIKLGPIDNPVLWGPSAVSMGNPHCVFFIPDAEIQPLERFGPLVENHPLFPDRANVTVATVREDGTIRARTWERGVGITDACGTAACATLVSAHRRRLTGREATVEMDGGPLHIHWRETDDHVLMTGAVRLSGLGIINVDEL